MYTDMPSLEQDPYGANRESWRLAARLWIVETVAECNSKREAVRGCGG